VILKRLQSDVTELN